MIVLLLREYEHGHGSRTPSAARASPLLTCWSQQIDDKQVHHLHLEGHQDQVRAVTWALAGWRVIWCDCDAVDSA
jgi:hypothetical protein